MVSSSLLMTLAAAALSSLAPSTSAAPTIAPASLLALDPRAGAPITAQKLAVSNLTQCGVAHVAWTGPGVEPYTLEIGTGGYYVGIEPIAFYSDLRNATSFDWVCNQTESTSMFFQLTDAAGQITYTQNNLVGPPEEGSSAGEVAVNGTLVCPAGEGQFNASSSLPPTEQSEEAPEGANEA